MSTPFPDFFGSFFRTAKRLPPPHNAISETAQQRPTGRATPMQKGQASTQLHTCAQFSDHFLLFHPPHPAAFAIAQPAALAFPPRPALFPFRPAFFPFRPTRAPSARHSSPPPGTLSFPPSRTPSTRPRRIRRGSVYDGHKKRPRRGQLQTRYAFFTVARCCRPGYKKRKRHAVPRAFASVGIQKNSPHPADRQNRGEAYGAAVLRRKICIAGSR